MSKEIRKVAQMLVGISSEYLAGTIEEDIFKVQIEFANDILNKAENLPISDVVGRSEQLKPLPPNECDMCGALIDPRLTNCGGCGL